MIGHPLLVGFAAGFVCGVVVLVMFSLFVTAGNADRIEGGFDTEHRYTVTCVECEQEVYLDDMTTDDGRPYCPVCWNTLEGRHV